MNCARIFAQAGQGAGLPLAQAVQGEMARGASLDWHHCCYSCSRCGADASAEGVASRTEAGAANASLCYGQAFNPIYSIKQLQ